MKIEEILVLHHSHLDVGYTHSQPIVWQLQYEFIEQALDLLDITADWDEFSKPRWTCEVTAQVFAWLKFAEKSSIEKFAKYIAENRIGIAGLEYNTTPNCNAEQLSLQLQNIKQLRDMFNVEIKTVHQHDVNGIPWAATDIMMDAGIELFIMATNNHFGGYTYKRPSVFRWQTPSQRELLVMNGAHYTMFDQLLDTPSNNIDTMYKEYESYLKYLKNINYDLDFIYLTTANAPVCYDNAPPNPDVAGLIRLWNQKGLEPKIRYVTSNMLLERIKKSKQPFELLNGDWTDYWNYGCASTAYETKVNQNSKSLLYTAEMLSTVKKGNRFRKMEILDKARYNINLYDEHTWGAFNSVDHDNEFVRSQSHLKRQLAYEGREITEYYLINELENFSNNPESTYKQDGLLVVNSGPDTKHAYIPVPDWWKLEGKRLRTARFGWPNRYQQLQNAKLYGPVELTPFSWLKIPFTQLKNAQTTKKVIAGDKIEKTVIQRLNRPEGDTEEVGLSYIESPFHLLEYSKNSGRITSLFDKKLKWQVIDLNSRYTFFQFVNEYPDPLIDGGRTALYARDLAKEKFDENCWMTDWKESRETAYEFIDSATEGGPGGITLILKFRIPGAKFLEQRITFQEFSDIILLDLIIHKEDIRNPQSIYFVFPLNLERNWKACFDSAAIHTELDDQQLPKSSRGWQTVETYAAMYNDRRGVALFCPDAPMVQMGNFNFGRKYYSIARNKSPLLLAWPLNNYWDTNFAASQPGVISLSYGFSTFDRIDKMTLFRKGRSLSVPMEIHPVMQCPEKDGGTFIQIVAHDVELLNLKLSADQQGIVVRVIKISRRKSKTKMIFPGKVDQAFYLNTLEEKGDAIDFSGNEITADLEPNKITLLYILVL